MDGAKRRRHAQATRKRNRVTGTDGRRRTPNRSKVPVIRIFALIAAAACTFGQAGPPFFRAEDVRPHGEAEPHPLVPGLLTWIFGANLGNIPGCTAENVMDRGTYKTELCGTRVLVGGI